MARERKGGAYVEDHASFGQMMVSEQLRPALDFWTTVMRNRAKLNTEQSGSSVEQGGKHGGVSLADAYEAQHGPVVTLVVQGKPSPRISNRVVNPLRHAAAREFGAGGWRKGRGTRDLRRAGEAFGDLAGEAG